MQLIELMTRAAAAYDGDGTLAEYFDPASGRWRENPDPCGSDGLARFVAIELNDTFDETAGEEEQLDAARAALESGARQLAALAASL